MLRVRPHLSNDRTFVLSLAPRLAIGKQPWRDLTLWLKTVEEWLTESINQHNEKTMVLIAEDEQGERLGFATVSHSTPFTGQRQAYIGELATNEKVEGRGVGSRWLRLVNNGHAIKAMQSSHSPLAPGILGHSGFMSISVF